MNKWSRCQGPVKSIPPVIVGRAVFAFSDIVSAGQCAVGSARQAIIVTLQPEMDKPEASVKPTVSGRLPFYGCDICSPRYMFWFVV